MAQLPSPLAQVRDSDWLAKRLLEAAGAGPGGKAADGNALALAALDPGPLTGPAWTASQHTPGSPDVNGAPSGGSSPVRQTNSSEMAYSFSEPGAKSQQPISAADLQQIRAISRPHPAVREVVETALMLLGFREATWASAQVQFERAEAFLEKMRVFDASRSVSRLQYQKLCRTWGGAFEEGAMEALCPQAAGLVRWCRAVRDLCASRFGDAGAAGETARPAQGALARRSLGRPPTRDDAAPTTNGASLGSTASPRGGAGDDRPREDAGWAGPLVRPDLGDLEVTPDVYSMSESELHRVRDLTVRKASVGEVTFPGELDLVRERRVLEELPAIVRLEPGEVVLYPDPGTKPREGEGLNRPATITLFGCKPPAGAFQDADSKARYRERIARMTEAKGAAFVDYDCDRGIWCFRVDHF